MNPEIQHRLDQIRSGKTPPGYKRTKIGIIPEEWNKSTVGNSLQIQNNQRLPISEEERKKISGKYPYYGPTKILDFINEYRVEGKYALIGEDGDHFLKFRDKEMCLLVEGKFNVNNHAHLIKGTENCITEWFYYFFSHRNIFSHLTRQGAGRYKLSKDSLRLLPLFIPPLPEQRRIAEILSTWDTALELKEKLLEQKKLQKKGLMQQLLTGTLRAINPQTGKPFEGEWQEVRLGSMFNERLETKHCDLPLLSIGENGVYPQSESNKKDTSNSNKSKYKRICPNDIGYNTMRMWQGRSALAEMEGIVSPAYTILKPLRNTNSTFFSYLFRMQGSIHLFKRYSQGLVDDTLNLKYRHFKIIKMIVPNDYTEQQAIAAILTQADQEIVLLEIEIEHLKEQKRGLMQLLLTGVVRVDNNQEN